MFPNFAWVPTLSSSHVCKLSHVPALGYTCLLYNLAKIPKLSFSQAYKLSNVPTPSLHLSNIPILSLSSKLFIWLLHIK